MALFICPLLIFCPRQEKASVLDCVLRETLSCGQVLYSNGAGDRRRRPASASADLQISKDDGALPIEGSLTVVLTRLATVSWSPGQLELCGDIAFSTCC